MEPHTITHGLKSFAAALGGSLNDDDINAAAGTEGGKELLAWLARQAIYLDDKGGELKDHAWQEVTLENDEILFRTLDPELVHDEKARGLKTYMPPSKLQKQAAFIKDENVLVQRQIDALTLRISKTKEASKALTQSIKALQRVIHTLDTNIRGQEATIAELSVNADYTVAATISNAKEVFRSLGCADDRQSHTEALGPADSRAIHTPDRAFNADFSEVESDLASTRAFLFETKHRISTITSHLRNALDFLSNLRNGQPEKIRDIESETSRLQAAFHALDSGEMEVDVETELRDISLLLEREASKCTETGVKSEIMATLLAETDDVPTLDGWVDHHNLDVQKVLHHAWMRDQVAGSLTEHAILNGACASLASVVEPLQSLRSSFLPLVSCIREVEAVIEAFIEELADIALPEADDNDPTSESEDSEMEANLRRVLSQNQDLRPPGALPLVLMTQDDILAELQEIRNRTRHVEATERARTEAVIQQAAARPVHNALPHIYANSPLHTSPPFAFPQATQDLEACVRKVAEELQAIANSVEEEFKSTFAKDSNIRRLDGFVEKWTSTRK